MSFFLGQKPRMLLSPRCFSWLISLPLSTLKYHSIRKRPPQNTLPKTVSLFCLLTLYLASCKHMGKYEYRHGYRFFDIQFISLSRMQSLWRQGIFFFFFCCWILITYVWKVISLCFSYSLTHHNYFALRIFLYMSHPFQWIANFLSWELCFSHTYLSFSLCVSQESTL